MNNELKENDVVTEEIKLEEKDAAEKAVAGQALAAAENLSVQGASTVKNENRLGVMPVGKLLISLALPAIVAQVINMLYNVVDRIYIARLGNDAALSGLTVCFPIIMIVAAFAALFGNGGAPLASIKMGEKNKAGAEKILGNCLTALVITSIVLTIVLLFTKRPILLAFGATNSSLAYADSYLKIYLVGTIFVELSLGLNMFITAQGYSKISMFTILIGAVANIILDPIFIFGFKMGVAGAALATVISQALSCAWVLGFILSGKGELKIRAKNLLPSKDLLKVMALGVSPFIMQLTESFVQLVFNAGFKKYSPDEATATVNVAAMGVVFTVLQMMMMPMMGLAQGGQPIISYNYGAKKIDRVRRTFKLLFITAFTLSALLCILVECFPKIFAYPLSPSPQVLEAAAFGIRIFMAGSFALGVQNACQFTLVALGQAKVSLFLALLRKVILLIPMALILPLFMNPTIGLFISEPIADIIAATVTFTTYRILNRKLYKTAEEDAERERARIQAETLDSNE